MLYANCSSHVPDKYLSILILSCGCLNENQRSVTGLIALLSKHDHKNINLPVGLNIRNIKCESLSLDEADIVILTMANI